MGGTGGTKWSGVGWKAKDGGGGLAGGFVVFLSDGDGLSKGDEGVVSGVGEEEGFSGGEHREEAAEGGLGLLRLKPGEEGGDLEVELLRDVGE